MATGSIKDMLSIFITCPYAQFFLLIRLTTTLTMMSFVFPLIELFPFWKLLTMDLILLERI